MSTDANAIRAEELLNVQVVAICDDAATSSISLGRSLGFTAKYTPVVGVRYTLSISVTKDATVYTTFTSYNIASLNKIVCDQKKKDSLPFFDEISGHLDYHRAFVRLHFQLPHPRDLVTPTKFDPIQCRPDVRRLFDAFALFSTTAAFSLYMPVDALPKRVYGELYNDFKHRTVDVQSMYKGEGGMKFDLAQYRHSNTKLNSAAIMVNVDRSQRSPSSHDFELGGFLRPASQGSTVSELDDTIAISTPSAFNDDGGKDHSSIHSGEEQDLPPPPYFKGLMETCLKHGLDDDVSVDLHQSSKRSRLMAMGGSSHCMSPIENQVSCTCETHSLKLRIKKQDQQIENQKEQLKLLWAAVAELRGQTDDLEEVQGSMDERLESVDVKAYEVGLDVGEVELKCNTLNAELLEIRQASEQWIDTVDEYLEASKDSIESEILEHVKLRLDQYVEEKHTNLQQAVNIRSDLRRILEDVLND